MILYQSLEVKIANSSYPVLIGNGLYKDKRLLRGFIESTQILIVTNESIASLYLEQVKNTLSENKVDVCLIPDGEEHKNRQTLFQIYDALINCGHHRDTTVIALGGGVVGDIAGFAAATYQRGVNFIQMPTTLLAQVDAAVGGKTAINYAKAKNIIGSFYQPQAVIMDLETLKSLPQRQFRAGLAEVIKVALIVGGDFIKLIESLFNENRLTQDRAILAEVIAKCCLAKAEIVAQDEREQNVRALLNLGHTFAHALESVTQYKRWLHGEAVAIGLHCAAILSHQLGHLDFEYVRLVRYLLELAKLPIMIPNTIVIDDLQKAMMLDKKIEKNTLRFVLLRGPGACFIDDSVSMNKVRETLLLAATGDIFNE